MTTSPDLQSRLALAANQGDLDECRRLLAAGADPAFADADKFTPLHEAAQGGHPAVCALLIEAGAPLDAVDKTNNTPLHEAARFNHPDVVRTLVKAGADLELPAYEGRTPLCQAALYGSKDALEALIDVGADVNARIEHDTSRSESGKKLGYLKLDIGVAVETQFSGTTALHLAAQAGTNCSTPNRPDHLGCAERLLAAGADVGAKDRTTETLKNLFPTGDVLHSATALIPLNYAGTLDMAKLLVAHGSPLNASHSPFASAVGVLKGQQGMDIAAFLLNQGYEPNDRDRAVMAKAGVEEGAVHHRAHEMRATERQQHLEERLNQAPPAAPHPSSPSTPSMVIGGAVWNARDDVHAQPAAVQEAPRQRMRL